MKTLLDKLHLRFESNMQRHPRMTCDHVMNLLNNQPAAMKALEFMENTGGEPDVLAIEATGWKPWLADCSLQSPAGRRSLCFDQQALESRKSNKPAGSAWEMAEKAGVKLMNEHLYRALQQLAPVDTTTSSWIDTPEDIRRLGGALFGDNRFQTVFIYHNGAESYYAARGFRAWYALS